MISRCEVCCIQVDMFSYETYLNVANSEHWNTSILANIKAKNYTKANAKLIKLLESINVREDYYDREQFIKERDLIVKKFKDGAKIGTYLFDKWGFSINIIESHSPIILVEM